MAVNLMRANNKAFGSFEISWGKNPSFVMLSGAELHCTENWSASSPDIARTESTRQVLNATH